MKPIIDVALERTPIEDALERARVVGVLDAWQAQRGRHIEQWTHDPYSYCELRDRYEHVMRIFSEPTPDAARKAAAEAIESGEL